MSRVPRGLGVWVRRIVRHPLNIVMLALSAFPLVSLLWDVALKGPQPTATAVIAVAGSVGTLGVFLFINRFRVTGIVCAVVQMCLYLLARLPTGVRMLESLYFWFVRPSCWSF